MGKKQQDGPELPDSFAEIRQFEQDLREGHVDPVRARQLLELFCSLVDTGAIQHAAGDMRTLALLSYLQRAFREYLDASDKSLEKALGLSRGRGRPRRNEETQTRIALAVLRLQLHGGKHEESVARLARRLSCGETAVDEAWRDCARDALSMFWLQREVAGGGLTEEEKKKLDEIFGETWALEGEAALDRIVDPMVERIRVRRIEAESQRPRADPAADWIKPLK